MLNMLYNVKKKKNSKWIDMIDIGTREAQSMSLYLFVSYGICKHLIKSLKSVISNPVYRQITSAALPRRIHPSQAAIFQILLSSGKRNLPVLHQKSFC